MVSTKTLSVASTNDWIQIKLFKVFWVEVFALVGRTFSFWTFSVIMLKLIFVPPCEIQAWRVFSVFIFIVFEKKCISWKARAVFRFRDLKLRLLQRSLPVVQWSRPLSNSFAILCAHPELFLKGTSSALIKYFKISLIIIMVPRTRLKWRNYCLWLKKDHA